MTLTHFGIAGLIGTGLGWITLRNTGTALIFAAFFSACILAGLAE